MDGWKVEWVDGWTDGRTDGWIDRQTDGWMDGRWDGRMDGRTDALVGWMEYTKSYLKILGWVVLKKISSLFSEVLCCAYRLFMTHLQAGCIFIARRRK
jgi:hypothetical protein